MLYTLVRGEREEEEEQEEEEEKEEEEKEEREKREGGGRGGGEKGGRGEERWEREEHKIFLFQSSVIVIGLAAFMRGRELSTLVVILSVCHNGKSLSGHQTRKSRVL